MLLPVSLFIFLIGSVLQWPSIEAVKFLISNRAVKAAVDEIKGKIDVQKSTNIIGPNHIVEFSVGQVNMKWGPIRMKSGTVALKEDLKYDPKIHDQHQGILLELVYDKYEFCGDMRRKKPGQTWKEVESAAPENVCVSAKSGKPLSVTAGFVMDRIKEESMVWSDLEHPECKIDLTIHDGKKKETEKVVQEDVKTNPEEKEKPVETEEPEQKPKELEKEQEEHGHGNAGEGKKEQEEHGHGNAGEGKKEQEEHHHGKVDDGKKEQQEHAHVNVETEKKEQEDYANGNGEEQKVHVHGNGEEQKVHVHGNGEEQKVHVHGNVGEKKEHHDVDKEKAKERRKKRETPKKELAGQEMAKAICRIVASPIETAIGTKSVTSESKYALFKWVITDNDNNASHNSPK